MNYPWPAVPLGEVLQHRKEFITIDDSQEYKRCRIQLHAKGIVLRDLIEGARIKTKEQQVCRSGEFLVAEIDAKVGGFGIVPEDLNAAIVSSHYFLFEIDPNKLDKHFLDYYIRTPTFREQVSARGTTNYAAIRPRQVLEYSIPLPPLPEQRRIVAKIEVLAAKTAEARSLRHKAVAEIEALVISLHVNLAGKRIRELREVVVLDEDSVPVNSDKEYPQVGIKSFGVGLFKKPATKGADTTYKAFNRLYPGALVLSQVKGWEGAIAVADDDLAGWFVSPEYRTFRCIASEASPDYLSALVRTEWFWRRLQNATRGVGARRERTRPEQFLNIKIPMPNLDQQKSAVAVFKMLEALKGPQTQTAAELDALLPAILDRAFKGEL